jgi:transposase
LAIVCARLAKDVWCRATLGHFGPFTATSRHGSGTWQAIHDRLRGDLRELLGGRLSKDFEAHPQTSEAWIRIAMIQLITRHLAALAK